MSVTLRQIEAQMNRYRRAGKIPPTKLYQARRDLIEYGVCAEVSVNRSVARRKPSHYPWARLDGRHILRRLNVDAYKGGGA